MVVRLPDFVGLGAQKAGTSWLAACLSAHPQIYMPRKETQFFTHKWDKGLEWYEGLFAKCPPGQICGEFSTSYLCKEDAIVRIKRVAPDAKLIAVLRHPILRSLALIRHKMMRGKPYGVEAVIGWSKYSKFVPQWKEAFGDRLLLIDFKRVQQVPCSVVSDTYRHIGLTKWTMPKIALRKINVSVNPKSVMVVRILDSIGHLRTHAPFSWFWWSGQLVDIRNWIKGLNNTNEPKISSWYIEQLYEELHEELKWYENWVSSSQ